MRAHMDVRSLEVFLSVAKHLNFTRAGEEVNLSQPSVLVRIRQLESELGVKLFKYYSGYIPDSENHRKVQISLSKN